MLFRVVCGAGLTMATFAPHKRFNNVDLPTDGRPTMATKALFLCESAGVGFGVCSVSYIKISLSA
jgi:hypothetical protein